MITFPRSIYTDRQSYRSGTLICVKELISCDNSCYLDNIPRL